MRWNKLFRSLACLLVVCCLIFNMASVPVKAAVVVDDLLVWGLIALVGAAAAGVVFNPQSADEVVDIGVTLQNHLDAYCDTDEKLAEYAAWLDSLNNFTFGGEDPSGDDGFRNTQIKLSRTILAGITAWCASVAIEGLTLSGDPEYQGLVDYGGHRLPEIPEDYIAEFPYYVIKRATSTRYLLLAFPYPLAHNGALGELCMSVQGSYTWYRYICDINSDSPSWYLPSKFTGTGLTDSDGVVWTSHDIEITANGSGSFLKHVEPIPLGDITLWPSELLGEVAPGLVDGSKTEEDIYIPPVLDLGAIINSQETAVDDLRAELEKLNEDNYQEFVDKITGEDPESEPETKPLPDGAILGETETATFLERIGSLLWTPIEWLGQQLLGGLQWLKDSLLTGLQELFVPTQEEMAVIKIQWDELLQTRFGAVYDAIDLIADFVAEFKEQPLQNYIDFPRVIVPLLGSDKFTFGGWRVYVVPDGMEFLIQAVKKIISILCTLWFINGLRSRYDRIMEGGGR